MNILVTGAKGFIGKNLVAQLETQNQHTIFQYDTDTDHRQLVEYVKQCEFVFHLAGINRPIKEEEYRKGNYEFTQHILDLLKKYHNKSPIVITSSVQALMDNAYGTSKRAAEEILITYGKETGSNVMIYRLPNVFGKWSRPNYNSAIATFCHNIARELPIQVNDVNHCLTLVYIDDVIEEFVHAVEGMESREGNFCYIPVVYHKTLGEIVNLIQSFHESRVTYSAPFMEDLFVKKLYSTYLSYLPTDQFKYPLNTHSDHRGSFTEVIKTPDRGQFSVNISKPGVIKGNHWHHTKTEKFLVVSGRGCIQLRRIDNDEIITYHVDGDNLEVVDIPPGYTHNLINEGDTDLITIIWANEVFSPEKPDTFSQNVGR